MGNVAGNVGCADDGKENVRRGVVVIVVGLLPRQRIEMTVVVVVVVVVRMAVGWDGPGPSPSRRSRWRRNEWPTWRDGG